MSQSVTNGQEVETTAGTIAWCSRGPVVAGRAPLVFLQGLLAPPEIWAEVVAELSAEHRCITVDWPFGVHRRPMRPGADLSPPGIARLVVEVLDALGVERAVLVGNDSGGVIAQLVAAAAPDRVERLVLISCDAFEVFPPPRYRPVFWAARWRLAVWLLSWALRQPVLARSRLGFGAVMGGLPDATATSTLASSGNRRDLRTLLVGSSAEQTRAAAASFASFARPVLVVWAGEDRLFRRSLGERLAGAFPHGIFRVIDGARTFVAADQPAALAAQVADFLGDQRVAA